LALNTAVSFVTNTDWQAYSGENTLSYLTQMLGLCVQNFLSAATGMAVLLALIRGLKRAENPLIGNFWSDITKTVIYILLPLSLFLSVALVSQGVVQTFKANAQTFTVEDSSPRQIPLGPAASQIAIKQLGTNGGGYYGANSAHPLENPTPLSNFLEMFSILLLPAACVFMFGFMTGAPKHSAVILMVMLFLFICGIGLSLYAENSAAHKLGVSAAMEGKETRFGVVNSVLWSVSTTAASNGSVNAMHSSLSPLAGGVALFNMLTGEVIFGGIGCGLYGMLVFVILTVFICGLLVGRTPQYFCKKIEKREVQMSVLVILLPALCILFGSSVALASHSLRSYIFSSGPHGFSEVIYAFASAAGNNGSAFGWLNANNVFYNLALSLAMFIGRFGIIVPCLAIAGGLSAKKRMAQSVSDFRTDDMLFAVLLLGIVIIFGVLTYFPALMLGPGLETLLNI
jgi:K+-transporting ATPase ATPase A chain